MVVIMSQARAYADFSPVRLFAVPTLALIAGAGLAVMIPPIVCSSVVARSLCRNLWAIGVFKALLFIAGFALISLMLERQEMVETWRGVRRVLGRERKELV